MAPPFFALIPRYENYFREDEFDHASVAPTVKTLAVFRDPSAVARAASALAWHPDGPARIAVAYAVPHFQARLKGRGLY